MSPAPFGALRSVARAHPGATTLTAGVVTHAAFVTAMLEVQWPEGDPGGLREAAGILEGLATKIEEGLDTADDAAAQVVRDNSGEGIDAFQRLWRGTAGGATASAPRAQKGFADYPPEVAVYCRKVAAGCRSYADAVETIRHVLVVMAVQLWANMLFTSMYGWTTAGVGKMVEDRIMKTFFKKLAQSQLKIFRLSVEKIVYNAFYYTLDSITYAGIQQALQAGIFALSGVRKDLKGRDVLSAELNAVQFAQGFGANMAFNAVGDLVKMPKFLPENSRWVDFLGRMAGSSAYSAVDSIEQNPTDPDFDWKTYLAKPFVHGVRAIKPS